MEDMIPKHGAWTPCPERRPRLWRPGWSTEQARGRPTTGDTFSAKTHCTNLSRAKAWRIWKPNPPTVTRRRWGASGPFWGPHSVSAVGLRQAACPLRALQSHAPAATS